MNGLREEAAMSEGAKHVLIQGSILGLLALAALAAILLLGGAGRADGASGQEPGIEIAEEQIRRAEARRRYEELPRAVPMGVPVAAGPPPESCCRWELLEPVPWGRRWEALQQGGAALRAIEAFPPVILLDQCSGRTWTLSRGPGGEFGWRELERFGPWGFRLDQE